MIFQISTYTAYYTYFYVLSVQCNMYIRVVINNESFKISVIIEKNWGTYEDFYTMHL